MIKIKRNLLLCKMFRLARKSVNSAQDLQKAKHLLKISSSATVSTNRSFSFIKNTRHQLKPCKYPESYYSIRLPRCLFTTDTRVVNELDYEKYCAETLESLSDYFDELVESCSSFESADVVYKDGVLTVTLGPSFGTYVINKQTPNKQIWLSSPTSGPKRFDFAHASNGNEQKLGYWIYKHSGQTLHELLDDEISKLARTQTKFQSLQFGSRC